MKRKKLQQAYEKQFLIGIRLNSQDWEEITIGFIVEISEDALTINEIDGNGQLTGRTIVDIEDIVSVDVNDRYQLRLQCIFDNTAKLDFNNQIMIWRKGDNLVSCFDKLISNKYIVTLIFAEEFYVTGIILNYDAEYILMRNIGSDGDEDGESIHNIEGVNGLRYGGIDEQKIKLLNQHVKTFYNFGQD